MFIIKGIPFLFLILHHGRYITGRSIKLQNATKSAFTEAITQSNTNFTVQPITTLTTNLTTNATTQPTTNATTQPTTNATTQPTTNATTNLTTSSPTPSPGMHTGTKVVVVLVVIIVVAGLVGLIYYCRNQQYVSYECLTEPPSKPTVSICSSAEDINVSGFIHELRGELGDNVPVEYVKLPYNDLDAFHVKKSDFDVIIVCHSINNRRFAITDVMDSLYDTFLKKAARALGPKRVGVIVHDFPMNKINTEEKFNMEMEAFQTKQPTTFRMASLVLIAGKLEESPTEIERKHWPKINQFITDALSKP